MVVTQNKKPLPQSELITRGGGLFFGQNLDGNLIQNALSPAKIVAVFADPDEKTAKVVVPDYQLSLAIGKEGQNARLAARLTGYKIDIKSETQAKDAPGFRFEDYEDEYDEEYDEEYEYEE